MRLPNDWDAERASGWWEIHHLIHKPCGFRTGLAFNLSNSGPFGEVDARRVIYGHSCEGEATE